MDNKQGYWQENSPFIHLTDGIYDVILKSVKKKNTKKTDSKYYKTFPGDWF